MKEVQSCIHGRFDFDGSIDTWTKHVMRCHWSKILSDILKFYTRSGWWRTFEGIKIFIAVQTVWNGCVIIVSSMYPTWIQAWPTWAHRMFSIDIKTIIDRLETRDLWCYIFQVALCNADLGPFIRPKILETRNDTRRYLLITYSTYSQEDECGSGHSA